MSLILAILGVVIRFAKVSFLISGYNTSSKNEKEKYDEKKLCMFVGNLLFVLACIQLLMAVAVALNIIDYIFIMLIGCILFFIVIIVAVIYMNTGNKFKK
jgi:cell division protein FtsX